MATSRLKIYNGALLILGERKLSALTEEREPRRLLDEVWDDAGVNYCLEQGQWQFAMRTTKLLYNPAIDPAFGYQRVFDRPDDWIATSAVCYDEYFRTPCLQYHDDTDYLYADVDELYVRYISSDAAYGLDYAKWPASFTEYVKAYFAGRIAYKLKGDDKEMLDRLHDPRKGLIARNLLIAKNKDAMRQPQGMRPSGSWANARRGRTRGPMGDGGSSGSLTG